MRRYDHGTPDLNNNGNLHQAYLGRGVVYALFVFWTLFAFFVYSHFSQLGDSESYLEGAYDATGQARTLLITYISTSVMSVVRVEVLVHLIFSLFAASGVWYLVKHARVQKAHKWPLFAILLNPNFGIWASVIGRESLFIGLLGYFMGSVVAYHQRHKVVYFSVALACLFGMIFIREPYGIGMSIFFMIFILYSSRIKTRLSVGAQAILLLMLGALVLIFMWPYINNYINFDVLPKAKSYFTTDSGTTRTWISISTTVELLESLWWSLPLALMGPTPVEVLARPVMSPFLVSGLVVLCVTIYSVYVTFRTSFPKTVKKILLLGWLPAMLVIIITYVPFGIYNPGSGIRYSSSFLLFIIMPSMFRSVLAEAAVPHPWPTKNLNNQ